MRDLTSKELNETNGGTIPVGALPLAVFLAAQEIKRQMDAIEQLGNLTGTTDDIHN